MKYLSLFSGIGGFELGIQQAYENIRKGGKSGQLEGIRGHKPDIEGNGQDEQYPSCIGFSEIDKYAIETYQSHYPEHHNYGDITRINANELPNFDLLVGGFPCQAFSIAGKRKGFEDTRGTLFFEIARILKAKQPRLFCLENVKGLLSHDNGNTFRTIVSTLNELGYDLQWQVLNSKNHGVPQNRERIFIIGHLRGTSRPEVFPFGGSDKETNTPKELREQITNCLRTNYSNGKSNETYIRQLNQPKHSNDRIYGTDRISQYLAGQAGGQGGKTGLYQIDTLQYKGLCDKLGIYDTNKERNSIKVLHELQTEIGEKAFTEWGLGVLNSFQQKEVLRKVLHGDSVRHETSEEKSTMDDSTLPCKKDMPESELLLLWESKNRCSPQEPRLEGQFIGELGQVMSKLSQSSSSWSIRRLTPTETERLQGFPDGWTIGSDTQRYKQCGNAVTVNVIKDIMMKLI